jgi:hypothetical protein
LQRPPGIIGELAQNLPLIDMAVNHSAQLFQFFFIPEITTRFVGGAAL